MSTHTSLGEALRRELAVKHGVDPRSIKKLEKGEQVRGMAGERAAAALAEGKERRRGAASGSEPPRAA